MNTHDSKESGSKGPLPAATQSEPHQTANTPIAFIDNRKERIVPQTIQAMVDSSPRVTQMRQLHNELEKGNASAASPAQLATNIRHNTENYSYMPQGVDAVRANETVGNRMRATLDPEDIVTGSSTGAPQANFIKAIRATFPRDSMIRGHLLNHDLGGFGVHENLFPITAKANSRHLHHVEKYVKNALYDANQHADRKGVYYEVNVTGAKSDAADNPVSNFECTANDIPDVEDHPNTHGTQLFDVTIASAPKKSPRGADYQNGSATDNARTYDTKGSKLNTWKHGSRKGKLNFDELIAAGKITISADASHAGGDDAAFATPADALLFMDEHDDEVMDIFEDLLDAIGIEAITDLEAEHFATLSATDRGLIQRYGEAAIACGEA